MGIRSLVPWRAKIAAKIALSRVPAGYALWRGLNLFRHGKMDDPAYAEQVFSSHWSRVKQRLPLGFVGLEMGPGDSLLSAVIAQAYGADKTWLVDVGPFAVDSAQPYRVVAGRLSAGGLPAANLAGAQNIQDVLSACHAEYCTAGLRSLRDIASETVDFIWSHAVLEHVRRSEFAATLAETYRILKPGGVASHCVDLRDHLGGKLNNLRFSADWWEDDSIATCGFYTNRIRYGQMLDAFAALGFDIDFVEAQRWSTLPTPRKRMDPAFRQFDDQDLRVHGFTVVLAKPLAYVSGEATGLRLQTTG
jgi:SAM-dependent methyltransferase